jgi:hypothetical protein
VIEHAFALYDNALWYSEVLMFVKSGMIHVVCSYQTGTSHFPFLTNLIGKWDAFVHMEKNMALKMMQMAAEYSRKTKKNISIFSFLFTHIILSSRTHMTLPICNGIITSFNIRILLT